MKSITVKGNHEFNEDLMGYYIGEDYSLYWILDGATPLFGTERLLEVEEEIRKNIDIIASKKPQNLKEFVSKLCKETKFEYPLGTKDYEKASFVAAFVLITPESIEYLTFADSRVFIPESGVYTVDFTFEKIHDYNLERIKELGPENFKEKKKEIYQNARKWLNDKYYAFTLDGKGLDYGIHGQIKNEGQRIYLYSDGVEQLLTPKEIEKLNNLDCFKKYENQKDDISVILI